MFFEMGGKLFWRVLLPGFKKKARLHVFVYVRQKSKSKVGDLSQGQPEGSVFSSYYNEV